MATNSTAATIKAGVKAFYSESYGSDITVDVTMYNSTGNVTTNATESVKNVYNITMKKLIGAPSTSSISIIKTTTKSNVTIEYPSEVQLSSPPMSGNFKIQCIDELLCVNFPGHRLQLWHIYHHVKNSGGMRKTL